VVHGPPDEDAAFEVGVHGAAGEVCAPDKGDSIVHQDDLGVESRTRRTSVSGPTQPDGLQARERRASSCVASIVIIPLSQDGDLDSAPGRGGQGCLDGWLVVGRKGDEEDLPARLANEVDDRRRGQSAGSAAGLGSGPDHVEVLAFPGQLDGLSCTCQEAGQVCGIAACEPAEQLAARVPQDSCAGLPT
jgi:hypothetical protein